MDAEQRASVPRRAPEVLIPFVGTIVIAILFLGITASFGAGAAASVFGVVFIGIAVAFLASAGLIWKRSRIGYVIAIVMSVLFILAFGSMAASALVAFADITTFLEVVVILPILLLILIYSILGVRMVWRKGAGPKLGSTIPRSSAFALLTIGFVIGAALIGVLANGAVLAIGQSSNTQADITIVAGASNAGTIQPFIPSTFTVKAGGTVTWVNKDAVTHTVTSTSVPSGAATFDSGNIPFGNTYKVTFTAPGTYQYYCSIHPVMKGTIIVIP